MGLDDSARRVRRTAFRPELVGQARILAGLGATDMQIAEALSVDEGTVKRWKEEHAAFRQALEEGRAEAEGPTDDTWSRRAAAFSRGAEKILGSAACEGPPLDVHSGPIWPGGTAILYLLKHRRPVAPDGGAPGGRLGRDGKSVADGNEVAELSDLELARRIAFILTKADQAHSDGGASVAFTDHFSSTCSTGVP